MTTPEEQKTVRAYVAEATSHMTTADLAALNYHDWYDGLVRGISAHHAGMLPVFKEVVEQLFAQGLVKAVFATETLALGINMPARSVVLERLDKFNGESRVDITPGEYTQLTGRAGRRGIDVEGHAVVLWRDGMNPQAVAGLASKRTYPLNSSFSPTYNMSTNLIARYGAKRSRSILETSFAQFQADRSVVGIAKRVRSQEKTLEAYREAMSCHLGDFTEYARLRRELNGLEKSATKSRSARQRNDAAVSLQDLLPGDVIDIPQGRNAGYAVVVKADEHPFDPRPHILTLDGKLRRVGVNDLDGSLEPESKVKIPKRFSGRSPQERKDLASTVRAACVSTAPHANAAAATPFASTGGPRPGTARSMISAVPCAPTRATVVQTASTTPAGPNARGNSRRKPRACASRSRVAPAVSRRPSTESAPCSRISTICARTSPANSSPRPRVNSCAGSTANAISYSP